MLKGQRKTILNGIINDKTQEGVVTSNTFAELAEKTNEEQEGENRKNLSSMDLQSKGESCSEDIQQ